MAKRTASTPTQKEIDAAVEKSAEHLEEQAQPPSDVHPKPTTPTKAEVEAAVEQSAEHLETQGYPVDTSTSAAAPVSAGGPDATVASAPVDGSRDKSMDAAPVFTPPITSNPSSE